MKIHHHITGFAIRGYGKTYEQWKPKKNEVLKCIFDQGIVSVMKRRVNCGSVPSELQKVSREFIMAGGNIEAKVIDKTPRWRSRGQEIPCIYIWWSDLNSKQIKDAVKAAKKAVTTARKESDDPKIQFEEQKIPPEEKPGTSSQNMTDNDTSGPAKSSKKQKEKPGTSSENQNMIDSSGPQKSSKKQNEKPGTSSQMMTDSDTSGSAKSGKQNEKVEGSHKRQSVEFGKDSPNEKIARMEDVTKPKKTLKKSKSDTMLKNKKDKELPQATVSDSKRVVQDMTDQLQKGEGMPTSTVTSNSVQNQQTIEEKILLSSKNFAKLAQYINKNWELLGLELGLRDSEILKIKEEQNSLELRIYHMFVKWNQIEDQSAYLHILQRAIKECPKVGYQQPELKNAILMITQEYKAQLPVEGSCKRQSVEFGKDSPNGKVARMEDVTKPKKTSMKKSKSDTTLKNKKDKELSQATVSDSKKILQKEDAKGDNVEEQNKGLTVAIKNLSNSSLSEGKTFGSFIDIKGHVETVLQSEAKVMAAPSVCKIFYPVIGGSGTATGFRVGHKYIMTAAHVTRNFLQGLQYAAETFAVFNYKDECDFNEEDKFFLGNTVYSNLETDISVIEIIDDSRTLPPPFVSFCSPVFDRGFHLIGHSQGNAMETNFVDKICIDDQEKAELLSHELNEKSKEHTGGRSYDCPPHNTIYNPHRFLFLCKFTKGGSGAPGIVLIGKTVYVTTVLLRGYPDWYYDQSMEDKRVNWPVEDCIQQGVNLKSLQEIMHLAYPELSVDIFGDQPIS